MNKCTYCVDLDDEGFEYPEDLHHGSVYWCEECDADYYKEWGSETILATNEQAQNNHPELKKL